MVMQRFWDGDVEFFLVLSWKDNPSLYNPYIIFPYSPMLEPD